MAQSSKRRAPVLESREVVTHPHLLASGAVEGPAERGKGPGRPGVGRGARPA